MMKKIPCVEKSRNLIKIRKSVKNQRILQVLLKKVDSDGIFFLKIFNSMRIDFKIWQNSNTLYSNRLNDNNIVW